jgi:hypothetical protein
MTAKQEEHDTVGSGCAVAVEKEDNSGRAVVRPPVSSCAAPGDRAQAVPGGAASRGEHATAVRAWRWWREKPAEDAVREACGSHDGAGYASPRRWPCDSQHYRLRHPSHLSSTLVGRRAHALQAQSGTDTRTILVLSLAPFLGLGAASGSPASGPLT